MPKTKISEFDVDPANNTDINSINIAEGCAPSGINNAIRQLMSDLKEFQTGAGGDPFNGAVNGTVGATTPASGAFTSLSASGAFSANGGATLGDASGDALTINSSAVSIPNGLNFGSNNLVLSSGNVGIGTSSLLGGSKVEIRQNADANYSTTFTTGTTKNELLLRDLSDVGTYSTPFSTLVFAAGSSGAGWSTITGIRTSSQNSAIAFGTASGTSDTTERVRIDGSGNVGIGTSSPSARLHTEVTNTTNAGNAVAILRQNGSGNNGLVVDVASTPSNYVADFRIANSSVMRLDASGKLLLGTTAYNYGYSGYNAIFGGSAPMLKLQSAVGAWDLYNSGSGNEKFYFGYSGADKATINQSTGAYTALSDINKKKDFEDSNLGLDVVMQLKPKLFRMLEDDETEPKQLGFIAQDVKDVIPQAYSETEGGMGGTFIGLQDRPFIAVLVKAIQELKAEVDSLKAQLNA